MAVAAAWLPLGWTALAAFGVRPTGTYPPRLAWPPTLGFFSEVGVAEPGFWQELLTSTALAAASALLTVATAVPAAYGLSRVVFRGRGAFVDALLVLATLPAMAYVFPLGELMRAFGLLDTYPGVVLALAAVEAPLAVYVLFGYLASLPREQEEAAWLDGAGVGRLLAAVVLPTAAPTVAAIGIVVFVLDWNALLVPLVLTSGHVRTVPLAMMDFFTFERELDWPTAAAALVISLVPLGMLVAIAHRLLDRFTLAPSVGHVRDESG